jgi:hypothetical protein
LESTSLWSTLLWWCHFGLFPRSFSYSATRKLPIATDSDGSNASVPPTSKAVIRKSGTEDVSRAVSDKSGNWCGTANVQH